jgi:hypothetical protein
MLPGVTSIALFGMWVAAALTLYTGYAYLQAGLVHARGPNRTRGKPTGAAPRREQRTA